jgi:predicted phosphodiesterase
MKLLLVLILTLILISSTVLSHDLFAKSKDSKARDAIIKAIGKSVEGKYSTIKLIQLSKSNISGYVIAYNTTKATPTPPPPVPPNPPPTPTGPTTKVCLVGDLKGSTVPSKMKDCNLKIGLGDLGYQSDLSYFKGLYFDRCVAGNHDTKEDGSSSLESETLAYCGDHWSQPIGNSTLLIGLNTNGDINTQVNYVKSLPLSKYKTIIVTSHKNGHVFPNAHHPAEASNLYQQLEKLIPNLYEISGHNHNYAAAANGHWFISGAGGKSHYTCETSVDWPVCDNSNYGYLELTIKNNDGTTSARFVK